MTASGRPTSSRQRAGDALRARARGWALNLAIVFLAHSEDNPVLLEVGRRTLSAVLEESARSSRVKSRAAGRGAAAFHRGCAFC